MKLREREGWEEEEAISRRGDVKYGGTSGRMRRRSFEENYGLGLEGRGRSRRNRERG